MGGHKERQASINRREGKRSRYKRCPQCKKLRIYRWAANWWDEGRKKWEVRDGKKICPICINAQMVELVVTPA